MPIRGPLLSKVVGVRELKTRLGTYLREVRRGRTIVVTDRGDIATELANQKREAAVRKLIVDLSRDREYLRPL